MSASPKTLVLTGATGVQGRSIIDAFSQVEGWRIVGLTRNIDSPSAKQIALLPHVTVVQADLSDSSRLVKVFQGADAVYLNVSVADFGGEEKSVEVGISAVNAAKEAGVGHLIHSVLPNVRAISRGRYNHNIHFNASSRVKNYIETINYPVTYVVVGYYFSNMMSGGPYLHFEQGNGTHLFTWPIDSKAKLPMVDTRADLGKFVRGILTGPTALARPAYNTIVAVSQMVSLEEQLAAWGEVNGVPFKFIKAEIEWWRKQVSEKPGISEDVVDLWVSSLLHKAVILTFGLVVLTCLLGIATLGTQATMRR
jgi:NAD(P)-dependent dehydrogenase (short-subunit alcohol dehydrogenase family)